jgi:hypothetical protein
MLLTLLVVLSVFAQRGGQDPAEAMAGLLFAGFVLLVLVTWFAGQWAAFVKAGEPGWAAIVPIYNMMVMARIGGRDPMFGLLCLVPIVNIFAYIIIMVDLCRAYDVGGAFAIGLILLPFIFWPILGFGSARFTGRRGAYYSPPPRSNWAAENDRSRDRRSQRDDQDDDDRIRRSRGD